MSLFPKKVECSFKSHSVVLKSLNCVNESVEGQFFEGKNLNGQLCITTANNNNNNIYIY